MTKGLYVILKPEIPKKVREELKIGWYVSTLLRLSSYLAEKLFTRAFKKMGEKEKLKVGNLSFVLSKQQADFIYKEHRGKQYHQGNVDYLTSGEVKLLYVIQEGERGLGLDFILHKFTAIKEEFRGLEIFKGDSPIKRYNLVHVPDSVERATEDLKMLGLIKLGSEND